MKRPFLSILISFVVGIVLKNKFNMDMNIIKILLLMHIPLGVAIFILTDRRVLLKYGFLSLMLLLGITKRDIDSENSKLIEFYDKQVSVIGRVEGVLKDEDGYEKHLFSIDKIKYEQKSAQIDEKIIVSIYGDTDLRLGDRALLTLKVEEPKTNRNPGLFDYKDYLESKGIFAVSSTKEYNVRILKREDFSLFERLQLKTKNHIVRALDTCLSANNSKTLKSIILGDNTYLEEDSIINFRKLGLSHILAVSGLHIGIIFAFIIAILSLFRMHKRLSMIFSISVVWIYASLIGFPPSVLRASTMFSFLIIARLSHSRYDALNILSLTAIIMLAWNTSLIFSVGFQLSFLATLTILIFIPKIKPLIGIKNKKLKSSLTVVIAAQIGVLPISFYYFNEFQTLSIVSNIIIAPILTLAIVIGFSIILVSFFSINASIALGIACDLVLNLSNLLVGLFSKLSYLNTTVSSPKALQLFFYYIAVFVVLKIIDTTKFPKAMRKGLYMHFFAALVFSLALYALDDAVHIQFIDVGQGDSAFVKLKNKNLLIDTGGTAFGNFDVGENILLPFLKKSGVKKLDGVFLSHFDADHVKGLIPLFGEIEIDNIFIGYKNPENELYRKIVELSKANNVNLVVITKGDKLKLDKHSDIEVMHPTDDTADYENENDKSLVFTMKIHKREILFTGDIEDKGEDALVSSTKARSVDIMKVPHHGSKTSSKQELIDHFKPRTAVIQLGKNNFGHPNDDVLERYKAYEAHIFRNDLSGLIDVEITKSQMRFKSFQVSKPLIHSHLKDNWTFIYLIYGGAIYVKMLKYRQAEDEKGLRCSDDI